MASDFDRLDPQSILDAVESFGERPTGEYTQLNSYENRVFNIRLETKLEAKQPESLTHVIAKFYRPHRWSRACIEDEHEFLFDLVKEGIPAVAPLVGQSGKSLIEHEGFFVAFFPRVLGRNPQEFLRGELRQVGRTLAHIHNVGARKKARHRPTLNAKNYGWDVLERLEPWVAAEVWPRYRDAAETICEYLDENLDESNFIRIHGDCHKGNLLHNGSEFFFVDFDDFCNGPVVQDFWMLLSGHLDEDEASDEQDEICAGYEELREVPEDWHLFEPLRGLRIISYAGWIASRWNDPFFKRIFPEFEGYNYWADEVSRLERLSRSLTYAR